MTSGSCVGRAVVGALGDVLGCTGTSGSSPGEVPTPGGYETGKGSSVTSGPGRASAGRGVLPAAGTPGSEAGGTGTSGGATAIGAKSVPGGTGTSGSSGGKGVPGGTGTPGGPRPNSIPRRRAHDDDEHMVQNFSGNVVYIYLVMKNQSDNFCIVVIVI